jgi:hypothetical protein
MSTIDNLREWLVSSNPGLVTREDLARVEARLDELSELLGEIEERLDAGSGGQPATGDAKPG